MVHLSETENRIYLVDFGVLAAGAALSRLQPRGMSRALFTIAASNESPP